LKVIVQCIALSSLPAIQFQTKIPWNDITNLPSYGRVRPLSNPPQQKTLRMFGPPLILTTPTNIPVPCPHVCRSTMTQSVRCFSDPFNWYV